MFAPFRGEEGGGGDSGSGPADRGKGPHGQYNYYYY